MQFYATKTLDKPSVNIDHVHMRAKKKLYITKNTNKYGVRRFTVNILVSTQVNVDGFLEKTFSATFKIVTL